MAQMDGIRRFCETPKTERAQKGSTFGQLLHDGFSSLPSSPLPSLRRKSHDSDEDHSPHRKSMLKRVKDKAKKLRYSLSGKKKQVNDSPKSNTMPSWEVTLNDKDDNDEDPEYLGAPMYQSALAPPNYRDESKHNLTTVPTVREKHVLASSVECEFKQDQEKLPTTTNKTITESVSEKIVPTYTAVSDVTKGIASKITGLTLSIPEETEKFGQGNVNNNTQTWDKGVSVKEYLMQKLEPGEDERALSRIITDAISPRRGHGEMGVVGKVKEALTSFLVRPQEQPSSPPVADPTPHIKANLLPQIAPGRAFHTNLSPHVSVSSSNTSPNIPVSTNAHEISEEENYGRILQTN